MLGKLFKHEFKNSYLEVLIINAANFVFAILTALLIKTKMPILYVLPIIGMTLLIGASFILLLIILVNSINNKLFTTQGYLTMTLPTSIDHILIPKIIVNIIWWILTMLVSAFSVSILLLINDSDFISFAEILRLINFLDVISFLISGIQMLFGLLLAMIILLLTLCILNIGKIKKVKLLLGFLIYFGITSILNYFTSLFKIIPFSLYYDRDLGFFIEQIPMFYGKNDNAFIFLFLEGSRSVLDFSTIFINILAIIGGYFLSRYLISHKLELE